jgi:hypothetical protein
MTTNITTKAHSSGCAGRTAVAVATIIAALPTVAIAWGTEGHQLVAEYATEKLSVAALSEANRLLAIEPGATLSSISTWADEIRNPATSAWHYVNFPRDGGCHFDADRMCIQGACVTEAIARQVAVLRSNLPDEQRLKALKYVVHFVADVHQPLHAGYADDRGGNSYQIQAFGRGTNLHSLWDSGLIRNWPGGLDELRVAIKAVPVKVADSISPQTWGEESCRVVSLSGFYPEGRTLPASYQAQWSATIPAQLASAGRRLSVLLESALTSKGVAR